MKHEEKESGFVVGAVLEAAIFGVLLAVGLFVPALEPLALQVGTALSVGIILIGCGLLLYAVWRIVTFPSRSRKAAAQARQRVQPYP